MYDGLTDRQMDRQTNRRTDRQTNICLVVTIPDRWVLFRVLQLPPHTTRSQNTFSNKEIAGNCSHNSNFLPTFVGVLVHAPGKDLRNFEIGLQSSWLDSTELQLRPWGDTEQDVHNLLCRGSFRRRTLAEKNRSSREKINWGRHSFDKSDMIVSQFGYYDVNTSVHTDTENNFEQPQEYPASQQSVHLSLRHDGHQRL
ncbi:hypothetical protein DPMN_025366 [Dreissena polymorpha]|uniref:Uncharacterized protein n=1 Tax=Dreissena polymorpha TaxID=45954 RepID=A0A9D4LR79_DREPO|nr:hypothetical protein DPMN_025366 [Dreissena polymorpha]